MRILMLGTGGFAVPTFRWLLSSGHEVPALVTRPAAGRRDKRSKIANPMREVAEQHHLPVFDPTSINQDDAIAWLEDMAADLMVVCDYGQILSSEALRTAPLGGINLHASLLPKYRGAAPINWAIYHGERETGVTVIHMTPRLDAGPCLGLASVEIGIQETADALESRLSEIGVSVVQESVSQLERWDRDQPLGIIQDQSLATKAPRLKKTDGLIDWTRTAQQIFAQVRAMKPWPGTYTYLPRPGKPHMRLLIDWAEPVDVDPNGSEPAAVIDNLASDLIVATGEGAMRITRVQPEGKKLIGAVDFVRGYRVVPGTRFCVQET